MGLPPQTKTALKRMSGQALARLIRLNQQTSTIVTEPADLKARLRATHPIILACWHGQFMMLVHLNPPDVPVSAMVARHGDAELIGQAMAAFGVDLIRGAGAGGRKKDRGGVHALRAAVSALTGVDGKAPASLVMTADVPPGPARRAGEGIITIARLSGCAIVPVAAASSRFRAFKTWSRLTINLPYSKLAFAGGAPIHVPPDADPATAEKLRRELEASLNAVTKRAYAMAGADPATATPPNPASGLVAPGLLLKAYGGLMGAARPLTGPLLDYRQQRGKEDGARLDERRGIAHLSRPAGPLLWFHAASVGETNAILPLIEKLLAARPDAHVLLTTTTVTSAAIAQHRLPVRAIHQFVPLDAPQYASAFLDYWKPAIAIFTESEIWPGLILATSARAIPLVLVNGRMSERSYKSWKRLSSVAGPLFSRFDVILAQNDKLTRWFRDCGGRNVIAAGNLKADAPPPPVDAAKLAALRTALGDRPRLLAASTHEGEDVIIAAAHQGFADKLPGFCTIIAPRHPERGGAIARDLAAIGLKVARRSLGDRLDAATDIYVADTIGELGTLYAACPIAFIGGSLIDRGGQNPLEAVAHDAAVLTGPSVHNFSDEYKVLRKAGVVVDVATAHDIVEAVMRLTGDPQARAAVAANAARAVGGLKGALGRTLAAIEPLLPPRAAKLEPAAEPLAHAS